MVLGRRAHSFEPYLRAKARGGLNDDRPRWNLSPTSTSLVGHLEGDDVVVDRFTWGMPGPAKSLTINARAETAADKPMFAAVWREGHCLIGCEGWYEWLPNPPKQPFYFHIGQETFFLAGLLTGGGLSS